MAFRRYIQRTLKEHGIGITKIAFLGKDKMDAIREFKKRVDPRDVFNPAKLTQRELPVRPFTFSFNRLIEDIRQSGLPDKERLINLLSNLERKGYVCRREDASDRRNKLVYLTPAGEALWQRLLPILDDVYNQAEQIIGPERIRTLSEELEEIHNRLENA